MTKVDDTDVSRIATRILQMSSMLHRSFAITMELSSTFLADTRRKTLFQEESCILSSIHTDSCWILSVGRKRFPKMDVLTCFKV